jgi:hypothetical protein
VAISFLDPRNAWDVDAVARLHEEHLADSPIARLGPRFLRDFFYKRLVLDGLVAVFVCHVGDEVAGFLSYTTAPGDFVSRGVRRHPLQLGWIMLRTILAGERSIADLWRVGHYVLKRGGNQLVATDRDRGAIEAISLITPPKFQKHVPEGGKSRLTVRLVETMATQARAEGVDRVMYAVSPKNAASNLLFNAMGCEFKKTTYAGETVFCYTHRVSG